MKAKPTLSIASDHAGFDLKEFLKKTLPSEYSVHDLGPSTNNRCDYPDFAHLLAEHISTHPNEAGILVCGSGIGMSMAANRHSGVRAAVVESEQTAKLSREHNDANVLCLGARILSPEYAKKIVELWLKTPFEGGRHKDRVEKIDL